MESIVQESTAPKRYGTETFYHRLEIHLIDTIGRREGINITELALVHGITKSAVSQAVKKLERKGLVERYRMPDNQKEVLLRISGEGRSAFEAHMAFHETVERPLLEGLSGLSEEEAGGIEKLLDLLKQRADLIRELEEAWEEAASGINKGNA